MPETKRKTQTQLKKEWIDRIKPFYIGRKIVGLRYMTKKEQDHFGWYASAPVFILDNGAMFFPSSDDEGNGPGSIFSSDQEKGDLPVIGG